MRTLNVAAVAASLALCISALVISFVGGSVAADTGAPVYLAAGDARSSIYVIYPETKTAYLCAATGAVQEPWRCLNLGTHP